MTTKERSSHGARTLPARYYTSSDIFDREGERIFGRQWLCIGLACTLEGPGSYFVAEVEGESLVVVKDRAGAVRVFHNVCRHRGTRLCADRRGEFSKYIVCPYHSWAYGLAGDLVAAPNMDEVEGFDPKQFPLHPVATEVWEGLIFVSLAPAPPPFAEALAPLVSRFARWRVSDLVSVHQTQYEVEANWKLLFQNYSECYHCPSLHPVLNRLTPYRDSSNDLEEGPVLGGPMRLSEGSDSMTMDGRACAAPLAALSGDERRLVQYYVVFPSCFLSVMPDYVLVHRLARLGPSRTRIECDWLFEPAAAAAAGFDPSGAIDFWDMTNRQDWQVCELSQQGISSRAYEPGPYSNLESMLAALDREYLAALGEA
ncbi:MAG: aromatic ring-hydroxylating oxygenase subunit alpha [Planctomycetota bacterium]|jgi:Rieske 2Fe-2S family protein